MYKFYNRDGTSSWVLRTISFMFLIFSSSTFASESENDPLDSIIDQRTYVAAVGMRGDLVEKLASAYSEVFDQVSKDKKVMVYNVRERQNEQVDFNPEQHLIKNGDPGYTAAHGEKLPGRFITRNQMACPHNSILDFAPFWVPGDDVSLPLGAVTLRDVLDDAENATFKLGNVKTLMSRVVVTVESENTLPFTEMLRDFMNTVGEKCPAEDASYVSELFTNVEKIDGGFFQRASTGLFEYLKETDTDFDRAHPMLVRFFNTLTFEKGVSPFVSGKWSNPNAARLGADDGFEKDLDHLIRFGMISAYKPIFLSLHLSVGPALANPDENQAMIDELNSRLHDLVGESVQFRQLAASHEGTLYIRSLETSEEDAQVVPKAKV